MNKTIMKTVYILLIITTIISCTNSVQEAETAYASELKELIPLKGHDPYEEGVLSAPYLKHRLIKMLGEGKYDTLQKVMHDCSPLGFNNDLIYWVGYGPDNPESNSGAIIIDLVKDEIYIGYEYSDEIQIYTDAQGVSENPKKLASWLNRRSRIIQGVPEHTNEADSTGLD